MFVFTDSAPGEGFFVSFAEGWGGTEGEEDEEGEEEEEMHRDRSTVMRVLLSSLTLDWIVERLW